MQTQRGDTPNSHKMSNQIEKSNQLDSSQILVEVQLKLIYYLETVFAFLKAQAVSVLSECAQTFNSYFADSFLYSAIFKCKTCNACVMLTYLLLHC